MPIDSTIAMQLRRAYMTMHRTAQAHFALLGVTVDQYVLLSVLTDREGVIQSELGESLSSDANTIGAMLRRLEEKELVQRKNCPSDRRIKRVYLTRKGKQLYKKLQRHSQKMHTAMDAAVGQKKRFQLAQMLEQITLAITEMDFEETE